MALMEEKPQSPVSESQNRSPLKRKPDLDPAEEGEEKRAAKQQNPDAPLDDSGDPGQDEKKDVSPDYNANADEEELEPVFSATDRRNRKMAVDGEEDEQKSGGSGDEDDFEKYLSDDSLTLMEAENIFPERVRPRDSLKLVSAVKEIKYVDDASDRDYCEGEADEDDEDDEETEDDEKEEEKEEEEDRQQQDDDGDDEEQQQDDDGDEEKEQQQDDEKEEFESDGIAEKIGTDSS